VIVYKILCQVIQWRHMVEKTEIEEQLNDFISLLGDTPEELTEKRVSEGAWTIKEIIGHLIDSASNNHQRFVRLLHGDLEQFPVYDQRFWVASQPYNRVDWQTLRSLWTSYNLFIMHLVGSLPPAALSHTWNLEGNSYTLEWLVDDYYSHMRQHRDQYIRQLAGAGS
jgi:hypothetical protein